MNPKTVCTMLGKGYNKLETIIIIPEQHLINMRLSKKCLLKVKSIGGHFTSKGYSVMFCCCNVQNSRLCTHAMKINFTLNHCEEEKLRIDYRFSPLE